MMRRETGDVGGDLEAFRTQLLIEIPTSRLPSPFEYSLRAFLNQQPGVIEDQPTLLFTELHERAGPLREDLTR